jgi:hypothetical protein
MRRETIKEFLKLPTKEVEGTVSRGGLQRAEEKDKGR